MKKPDTRRARKNLQAAVDNVEHALHQAAETTGERVGDLRSRAGRRLHRAHDRIGELEHRGADRLRAAGQHAGGYVRAHPWQLLAGLVAVVLALSVVARTRM